MAKKKETVFICTECGNEYLTWQGRCNYCGAWNTIVEQKIGPAPKEDSRRRVSSSAKPTRLNAVGTHDYSRISTGVGELDRVLGGGLVKGSLVLISGEPGIGKSTLIVQAANSVADKYGKVLYVSGEESEEQVKLRADRVCRTNNGGIGKARGTGGTAEDKHAEKSGYGISDDLLIFPETNMESILSACESEKPVFLIIDSIQTMYSAEVDSIAGSITQIRACSNLLMTYAKTNNVPVFIVAHVNKSGDLAGPKTIEHMVDCVLNFVGERDGDLRILRSFKNRFGTTDEIGAFRMAEQGMVEVRDISGSLLENPDVREEGSVVSAVYEGSRPVFFEIQALVTPANVGFARRTSIGIDNNRLNMILAVLEKKAGISLLNHDVYVNVVGGLRPDSPATDLAVALAIYSSYSERTSPYKLVALGEVGLTGNLRRVRNSEKIAQEAARLGYDTIILPSGNSAPENDAGKTAAGAPSKGIRVIGAGNLKDALSAFLGKPR